MPDEQDETKPPEPQGQKFVITFYADAEVTPAAQTNNKE